MTEFLRDKQKLHESEEDEIGVLKQRLGPQITELAV